MLAQIPNYTDTVCQRRYVRVAPQSECAKGLLLEHHRVDSLAEELRQLASEHGLIQIRSYEHVGKLPYYAGGKLRCEGFYSESECKPRTEPLMLDDGGIVTPDGKGGQLNCLTVVVRDSQILTSVIELFERNGIIASDAQIRSTSSALALFRFSREVTPDDTLAPLPRPPVIHCNGDEGWPVLCPQITFETLFPRKAV